MTEVESKITTEAEVVAATLAKELETLLAERVAAGRNYSDACAALHQAYVSLAALDIALDSNALPNPGHLRSFTGEADQLPFSLAHPVYAPRPTAPNWNDEIRYLVEQYSKQVQRHVDEAVAATKERALAGGTGS